MNRFLSLLLWSVAGAVMVAAVAGQAQTTVTTFPLKEMTGSNVRRSISIVSLDSAKRIGTNIVWPGTKVIPASAIPASGVARTNLYPGLYRVSVEGLPGYTDGVVPETNVVMSWADCAAIVPSTGTLAQYYTRSQVDSLVGSAGAVAAGSGLTASTNGRLTTVLIDTNQVALLGRNVAFGRITGTGVFNSLQAPGFGATDEGGVQLSNPLQSMNGAFFSGDISTGGKFYGDGSTLTNLAGIGTNVAHLNVTNLNVAGTSTVHTVVVDQILGQLGSNNLVDGSVVRAKLEAWVREVVDRAVTNGSAATLRSLTVDGQTPFEILNGAIPLLSWGDLGIAPDGSMYGMNWQIKSGTGDIATGGKFYGDGSTLTNIAGIGTNVANLNVTNLNVAGTSTVHTVVTDQILGQLNGSNNISAGTISLAQLSPTLAAMVSAPAGYDFTVSLSTSNDTGVAVWTNTLASSNTWKGVTEVIGAGPAGSNFLSYHMVNFFRGTNSQRTNYWQQERSTNTLTADWEQSTAGAVLKVKGAPGENMNWWVAGSSRTVTNGVVGGGGASLAFGSLLGRAYTAGGQSAYSVTAGATVASGDGVIVFVRFGNDATVPTLTDAQGNTYSAIASPTAMAAGWRVFFSKLTTALGASDTIAANFSTTDYRTVTVAAFSVTGVGATQPDVTATFYDYMTAGAVNLPFTTVAENTVAIAQVVDVGNTQTYTVGSGWTQDGSYLDHAGSRQYWVHQAFSSTGAKQVGGSFPIAETGEALVVVIK
jgi:ribosomal protein S13